MSSICKIIFNLRHPKGCSTLLAFISGFIRKIISIFYRVLFMVRRRKAINPVDHEDLEVGLHYEAEYKEELYEASISPSPMEHQKGIKGEATPICPDTPALVDKVKDHESFGMFCTICHGSYPRFCENPEEHIDNTVDYTFCRKCREPGHITERCPEKWEEYVMFCTVCDHKYPQNCENQEEHGSKVEKRFNYCGHCCMMGHLSEECKFGYYCGRCGMRGHYSEECGDGEYMLNFREQQ